MSTDHIKERNMIMQVLLVIITLGIYAVYWFYVTLKEMHIANGKDAGAGVWTVLALIPLANLFTWWHYSMEYEEFCKQKYPGIPVVTYVNTTADVKAETDVCCTSSNAVQVVEHVALGVSQGSRTQPEQKVVAPDWSTTEERVVVHSHYGINRTAVVAEDCAFVT